MKGGEAFLHERLPERDWKHLRAIEAIALDRYCARVLEGSGGIIRDTEASHHQRYLRLYRVFEERNAELARAFDDLRQPSNTSPRGSDLAC